MREIALAASRAIEQRVVWAPLGGRVALSTASSGPQGGEQGPAGDEAVRAGCRGL